MEASPAVIPELNAGLAPPLKNVRLKRFRKTAAKQVDDAPEVRAYNALEGKDTKTCSFLS